MEALTEKFSVLVVQHFPTQKKKKPPQQQQRATKWMRDIWIHYTPFSFRIEQRKMQRPPSPTVASSVTQPARQIATPPLPEKKTKMKLPKDFAARSLPTPSSKKGLSSRKTSKERESFVKEASIRISAISPENVENAFEREPSLRLFDLKNSNDNRGDTSYSNNFSDPVHTLHHSDPTMGKRENESRSKMSAADFFDTSDRSNIDESQRSQYRESPKPKPKSAIYRAPHSAPTGTKKKVNAGRFRGGIPAAPISPKKASSPKNPRNKAMSPKGTKNKVRPMGPAMSPKDESFRRNSAPAVPRTTPSAPRQRVKLKRQSMPDVPDLEKRSVDPPGAVRGKRPSRKTPTSPQSAPQSQRRSVRANSEQRDSLRIPKDEEKPRSYKNRSSSVGPPLQSYKKRPSNRRSKTPESERNASSRRSLSSSHRSRTPESERHRPNWSPRARSAEPEGPRSNRGKLASRLEADRNARNNKLKGSKRPSQTSLQSNGNRSAKSAKSTRSAPASAGKKHYIPSVESDEESDDRPHKPTGNVRPSLAGYRYNSVTFGGKEIRYESAPKSLVFIWILIAVELILDLIMSAIAMKAFLEEPATCCEEPIKTGTFPIASVLPFFVLVIAELLFLFRAMMLTIFPPNFLRASQQELVDERKNKLRKILCCKVKPKVIMWLINFLTIINPFFGFIIAWLLMHESDKTEALAVLGLEAASILLHFISVHLEQSAKSITMKCAHSLVFIPFLGTIAITLWYLQQGGAW